jgi:hypothetical protein
MVPLAREGFARKFNLAQCRGGADPQRIEICQVRFDAEECNRKIKKTASCSLKRHENKGVNSVHLIKLTKFPLIRSRERRMVRRTG